jgi:hypothetical protein
MANERSGFGIKHVKQCLQRAYAFSLLQRLKVADRRHHDRGLQAPRDRMIQPGHVIAPFNNQVLSH